MRILRIILGLFLVLLALGLGVLSTLFFMQPQQQVIPIGDNIQLPLEFIFAGLGIVSLLLGIKIFSVGPRKPRTKTAKKPATKLRSIKIDTPTTAPPPSTPAATRATDNFTEAPFPPPQAEPEDNEDDTSTYARLEDPQAMARLVAIEQGDLNREVVSKLCKEFFPALVGLVDHIEANDNKTLEALGKHIIGIARNYLKMTDKSLNDNQFSIFQERTFKAEQETFLRMYKPDNSTGLQPEQLKHIGLVVDRRAWESMQRLIRGKRTDWKEISLANAKEYL